MDSKLAWHMTDVCPIALSNIKKFVLIALYFVRIIRYTEIFHLDDIDMNEAVNK